MTSTLTIRKTPKPVKHTEFRFKQPFKGVIARKFYDHDGSLSGEFITLSGVDLNWLEGVIDGFNGEKSDIRDLEKIQRYIQEGHTIDIWIGE